MAAENQLEHDHRGILAAHEKSLHITNVTETPLTVCRAAFFGYKGFSSSELLERKSKRSSRVSPCLVW